MMGESLGEVSGEVLALPPRSCRRRSDGRRAPTRVPGARVDRQPAPAGKFGEWPPKLHVRGHVELRHRFDLNLNDVVKFLWYCPNIYSTRASRSWTSSEGVKTSSALSSVPESRHGCVSSTTRTTRTMSPPQRRHRIRACLTCCGQLREWHQHCAQEAEERDRLIFQRPRKFGHGG